MTEPGRVPSPWEDECPVWSDAHDVLWDILTSYDMHGATATRCARFIMATASSGLAVQVEDETTPARTVS